MDRRPIAADTAAQLVEFFGAVVEGDPEPVKGCVQGLPDGGKLIACEYADGSSVQCVVGAAAPIQITYWRPEDPTDS